ncbi:MAG: hypothetical protein J6S40_03640, partial [Thermoguttaceae bacterium]|nr:hypothetical protein [Thermoguttaceae bacterium]
MNKLSMFFKKHPLLALFLTSAITICLINLAITLQAKRFGPEVENNPNSWNFTESTTAPPRELPSPVTVKESVSPVQSDAPAIPHPNEVSAWSDNRASSSEEIFFDTTENETGSIGSELAGSPVLSAETVPAETASVENGVNEEEVFRFASSEDATDANTVPSAEISESTDTVEFFADTEEHGGPANPARTSAEATSDQIADTESPSEELDNLAADTETSETHESEHVDFFADETVDDIVAPVREEDVAADPSVENLSESPADEPAPQVAEESQASQEEEKVDFFDNIAVSGPDELTTTDLNWIPADPGKQSAKTEEVSADDQSDLGWELVDSDEAASSDAKVYEPHEPNKMVAENFDSQAEAAPEVGTVDSVAENKVDAVGEPAPASEAVVAEPKADALVAENTNAVAPAEAAAAESNVTEVNSAPFPSKRCYCTRTFSERTAEPVETASLPADGETAEIAEIAETAKVSETVEPTETAEVIETAEPVETEPAAAPETAVAAAPAARGTEVWAISTENLSGYSVQPNQLYCWRAEAGQFIGSSVNEYKETLTADVPTVILIHGNMTDWSGALRHAQSLKRRIDQMRTRQQIEVPYRLVIWKWASERQDQRIRSDSQYKAFLADLNGFYLASFLSAINGVGSDVTILGFSFGARTIGCALELMAGGSVYGRVLPEEQRYVAGNRYHAILLAGACNYGDFSVQGQYAHGSNLISSMINVFNPVDNALSFYPLLYGPAGPQAIGVAPIDPKTVASSFKNRLWSINSSGYGAQHNFDNLLYSISDPLLGNMIYAGKIWSAADAIPAVSDGVVDPSVKEKSDAESAQAEEEKIVAEN